MEIMIGPEIDVVYEKGVLKLPRELPLVEGATVRITIHPPHRPGVVKHVRFESAISHEERERLLSDTDEGALGDHSAPAPT
jgi:predicted DNA-binding antitoxin AbrB/MazE fold protein